MTARATYRNHSAFVLVVELAVEVVLSLAADRLLDVLTGLPSPDQAMPETLFLFPAALRLLTVWTKIRVPDLVRGCILPGVMPTIPTLPLRSGATIPVVGLGVFRAPAGRETRDAVLAALRAGYRHIDTARIYGNEADVGAAVRESGVPRDEVFITTKLWNDDQGYEQALRAFDSSLARLGLEHIDLYLLHWPVAGRRLESWRALEKLHAEKRARSIGVSNFLVPHLEELLSRAQRPPDVNQIEVHPFLQRRETRARCAREGIVVEAYSPLAKATRLGHPVVVEVARAASRTPAQVMLRWGLQHGMVVLPKSTRPERIVENGALFDFELDAAAMARLDGLEANLTTGWDPAGQR